MRTIASIPENRTNEMPRGAAVAELDGVEKSYGSLRALSQVRLSLRKGQLLALLGPNGAGKTTAVKLLLGLMAPDRGTVKIFGGNPRDHRVRVRTGAMLQVARVPETLRVREHVDLFSSYYPNALPAPETLAMAGVESVKNRLFGELSGGQRQRVLFALAICGNPDLLFLDEPTVGLDVEARRLMWKQIRSLVESGKSVLLTTHYLEEADALADRVVVLNRGEIIAEGSPAEIKSSCGGKRIRCKTSLGASVIGEFPGVVKVRQDRGEVEIQTTSPELALRELLQRDSAVSDIEVTTAGLEDAFLSLTGQNGDIIQHAN
jgi:ABC-2 type transport system ATP-binding protein